MFSALKRSLRCLVIITIITSTLFSVDVAFVSPFAFIAGAALPSSSLPNPCPDNRKIILENSADTVKIQCAADGSKWSIGLILYCPTQKVPPAEGGKCPDGSDPVFPVTRIIEGNNEDPYGRSPEAVGGANKNLVGSGTVTCAELIRTNKINSTFATVFCPPSSSGNAITVMIGKIADYIVGIIGTIMIIMIIVSGIQMAASAGNPDAISSAKKRLVNVIISLALLLSIRAIMALLGVPI